jgi:type I restriction enzyme S subunit
MAVDVWETVPLEQLVEAERGISYGIVQPGSAVSDGVPIVRVSDIRNGRISTADPLKVSRAIETAYSRTRLRGGELLLTLVGTVGEAAVVPEALVGWNTARAVAVIPVRRDVSSYWVQIALRAPDVRAIINSRLNTTVQATLNLRDVAQLPIALPPPKQRERIIQILGALDDKIELNRRINETLEAIARTIFKSWFVDFDPVRAKVEGGDTGLPKYIADLFPDSFEESELAEIPRGWQVTSVSDIAAINAHTLAGKDPLKIIDYIEISEAMRGNIGKIVRYARGEEPSRARRRLRHGDTVLSTVRPDRSAYFLSLTPPETLIASTGFAVLSPLDGNWAFLYSAMTQREMGEEMGRLADGGAYPAVRPDTIGALKLVVPGTPELLSTYDKLVRPFFECCEENRIESTTLSAIRDALLPKLISGEIRIKNAEHADNGHV